MADKIIEEDLDGVAASLKDAVGSLKGRRIFLTGGTGFFGKWLLHSFLWLRKRAEADLTMTVLSRDPQRFLDAFPEFRGQQGLDFVAGDVRSFELPGQRTFDLAIHGATAVDAKLERENPDEVFSVITKGTRNVLDVARRCSVRRFLFISSGAVYGPQPPALAHVPETYEGVPTTAYGKGKKASEQMCLEAAEGFFDCVIARPFAFVGPHLPIDTHFAVGNFIRDCLANSPIVIQGDGTPLRSYLYAADLAEWLWTLLLRGEHAKAYNVGTAEGISVCDLAALVRKCAETQNEIVVKGKRIEGALPARYVPSVERAGKELGLFPRHSLPLSVTRTIAWHRALQKKGARG